MDGGLATGQIVSANSSTLRIRVASGEVDLAAVDVMRVDRVADTNGLVRDGAKGAAFGAGAVGVLGLLAGRVPPPRLFAAGGIIGAYENIELASMTRTRGAATTIYLAPAAAPARAAE